MTMMFVRTIYPKLAGVGSTMADVRWPQGDSNHYVKDHVFDPRPNQAEFLGEFRPVLLPAHGLVQNLWMSTYET